MGMIYNEFIKLFAKKSTIILLIAALAFSIGIPFIQKDRTTVNYYYGEGGFEQIIEDELSYYKGWLDGTIGEGSLSRMDKANFQASVEVYELLITCKLTGWDDWRYQNAWNVINLATERNLIKLITSSKKPAKLIEAMTTDGSIYNIDSDALNYYYEKGSLKKFKARAKSLQETIDGYLSAFENNDPAFINELNLKSAQSEITQLNKQIKDIKKLIKKTTDKKLKAEYNKQIEEYTAQIADKEELLVWKQYRVDNNISLSSEDWRNQSVNMIEQAILNLQTEVLTQEEYDKRNDKYQTYEQYVEEFNKSQQESSDNIIIYGAYLDNATPPMEFARDTRGQIDGIYNIITVVCLIMAVLTANIVASEYHKGTIRLLLIRPKKRYKILSSKLSCIIILSAVMTALLSAGFLITTIKIFGKEALSYPIYTVQNGALISKDIFETLMPAYYTSLIQILFIVSLAFFFTTVVKSAILSVAMPIIITAFSQIATMLLISAEKFKLVRYLPTSYISMWEIINKSGNLKYYMENNPELVLDTNYGFWMFVILSVLLFILSYAVFDHRDVKN